jgi:hypothetical protein
MHSGNEWLEPTGSQVEMDCDRRRIAARERLRPEMENKTDHGQSEIAARYGSRPDMDGSLELDIRRWMTGDG